MVVKNDENDEHDCVEILKSLLNKGNSTIQNYKDKLSFCSTDNEELRAGIHDLKK